MTDNVELWFLNDEGLYRLAQDAVRRNQHKTRPKADAAREILEAVQTLPDGTKLSLTSIRQALTNF